MTPKNCLLLLFYPLLIFLYTYEQRSYAQSFCMDVFHFRSTQAHINFAMCMHFTHKCQFATERGVLLRSVITDQCASHQHSKISFRMFSSSCTLSQSSLKCVSVFAKNPSSAASFRTTVGTNVIALSFNIQLLALHWIFIFICFIKCHINCILYPHSVNLSHCL